MPPIEMIQYFLYTRFNFHRYTSKTKEVITSVLSFIAAVWLIGLEYKVNNHQFEYSFVHLKGMETQDFLCIMTVFYFLRSY